MTIGEYLRRLWKPGQVVCEINPDTGGPAKLGDHYHGLATTRVRMPFANRRGVQRRFGVAEPSAICPDCINLFGPQGRRYPL